MARWGSLALTLALVFVLQMPARAASPFADWSAIVVAGDWRAHSGRPSEAFDNARHDIGQALITAGFQPQNLREFSVRPGRYRDHPAKATVDGIYDALVGLTAGG